MTKTSAKTHRSRLVALRAETEARLAHLLAEYDSLAVGSEDVGAGDDEGGSESDVTFVERDRLRAQASEESEMLVQIDAAIERASTKGWENCRVCGKPIGEDRLDALPTTDVCVTCKAAGTSW